MIRLNLGFIRSSSLPGSVGLCASDIGSVAAIVNEAQERLLHDPMAPDEGFWGGWGRMVFNVTVSNRNGYIITPTDIARIIVMDVCQKPVRIRNGFYEFLEFSPGLRPRPTTCLTGATGQACSCSSPMQAYERDTVVTLSNLNVSPSIIRFYPTNSGDLGKRILVQGTDQNGQIVYGVDPVTQSAILGEYVTLTLPYVDTINSFNTLTGFVKDQTIGPIQVFQVDSSGNQTALSSMEPNEVTPLYRRYLLDGLPLNCCNNATSGTVQVTAQVKYDYVPVQSDSDCTLIQSLPALIEECQSIRYSRMDSKNAPQLEAKHHAKALQLLFGQIDHYLGKTNTAINVPIFGSNKMRLQPQ